MFVKGFRRILRQVIEIRSIYEIDSEANARFEFAFAFVASEGAILSTLILLAWWEENTLI